MTPAERFFNTADNRYYLFDEVTNTWISENSYSGPIGFTGPYAREMNSVHRNQDEARPEWMAEHSAWIRQHAPRMPSQDTGFIDLCPIRHRLATPRLSALQEWRRLERRSKQFDQLVLWSAIAASILLGWLSLVLEGRL